MVEKGREHEGRQEIKQYGGENRARKEKWDIFMAVAHTYIHVSTVQARKPHPYFTLNIHDPISLLTSSCVNADLCG